MHIKNLKSTLEYLPVPILPTMVGAATLSNIWAPLGFTWIRHITMWVGALIILGFICKIILHFDTFKTEYKTAVPASLLPGLMMFLMIFGSYLFSYHEGLGRAIWFVGVTLYVLHMITFTYLHFLKDFQHDTFGPTWFVSYAALLVSTVVSANMGVDTLGTVIVYYGFLPVFVLLPIIVLRLIRRPILTGPLFMSKAIVVAPPSLFLVSYLNFIDTPNPVIVYITYAIVLLVLVFIVWNLPKFFSFSFHPGFASLTFPLAIACVATNTMSNFMMQQGYEVLGSILKQLGGLQLYMATAVIGFVLFNFFSLLQKSLKAEA